MGVYYNNLFFALELLLLSMPSCHQVRGVYTRTKYILENNKYVIKGSYKEQILNIQAIMSKNV